MNAAGSPQLALPGLGMGRTRPAAAVEVKPRSVSAALSTQTWGSLHVISHHSFSRVSSPRRVPAGTATRGTTPPPPPPPAQQPRRRPAALPRGRVDFEGERQQLRRGGWDGVRGVGAAAEGTLPGLGKGHRERAGAAARRRVLRKAAAVPGAVLGAAPRRSRQRGPAARPAEKSRRGGPPRSTRGGRPLSTRPAAASTVCPYQCPRVASVPRDTRSAASPGTWFHEESPLARRLAVRPRCPPHVARDFLSPRGAQGWAKTGQRATSVLPTPALEMLWSWENKCPYAFWHPATCGDGSGASSGHLPHLVYTQLN